MTSLHKHNLSRAGRLRRELRNPSLITVVIIVLGAITILLAPFAPGWSSTARDSFEARAEDKARLESSLVSASAIVASQIAPWMAVQARNMIAAEGPLDWKAVSFKRGPCDPENLSQLPGGKYADAITQACGSFHEIQLRYSGDCFIASTCDVPEAAKSEITMTLNSVWDAFSDAGFVLPYPETEQQVGP